MTEHKEIQFEIVKLTTGERLLRLTEHESGLSLEKKLDPAKPVVRQKEGLLTVFKAALARAEVSLA